MKESPGDDPEATTSIDRPNPRPEKLQADDDAKRTTLLGSIWEKDPLQSDED